MKQKIVLRLQMNDERDRRKAMKTVVGHTGVLSTQIGGQQKDQLEVVGEEVDSVTLTKSLRKKMGFTELVSVSAMEEKKVKKAASVGENNTMPWTYTYERPASPHPIYEVRDGRNDSCSLM